VRWDDGSKLERHLNYYRHPDENRDPEVVADQEQVDDLLESLGF
jgi:chemotaxis regulatin CheY-phosphate phosphatase CheZ